MPNVNVELSQDDALMLADACLNSMYHYRRMIADSAELSSTANSGIERNWIDQVRYWRDLYQRLFAAAVGHEATKLPDISGRDFNFFQRRKAAEAEQNAS